MISVIRRFIGRHKFDQHREFLNREKRGMLPNEIFSSVLTQGYVREALGLFPAIDWEHHDQQLLEAIDRWAKTTLSTYATELIVQLDTVGWAQLGSGIPPHLTELVRRMLEHRNYEVEQWIFAQMAELEKSVAADCPIEIYVSHFFHDKQLIGSIGAGLGLREVVENGEAARPTHERSRQFSPSYARYRVTSNISLFYAYRHLLLRTYHNGEGRYVGLIHSKSLEVQARLRRALPAPSTELKRLLDKKGMDLSDIKLLSPDWSALIGHNGHLNVHLMMRQMGWWHGSPVVLAYKDRIANKSFLSLFSELCEVWILEENVPADVWHELASLVPFLGVTHQAFAFEDGRAMYWNDAGAMAVNQWDSENGSYPLRDIYDRRLRTDDQADGMLESFRRRYGMQPNDWYVCLHMRESAARNEKDGVGEAIRNSSFANYIDAIRLITDRGGWVVRMGSPKAEPLPELARVIDYARSPEQIPLMDIHLVRRARMFIGTTSGFAYVASSFGIPTAMVNAISSVGLLWSRNTRFALKPVHTAGGRMLSLHDVTSEEWRWAFPTHETVARAGLTVRDNSSDEILETVREVLDDCDANCDDRAGDEAWQKSLCLPWFFGSSRPSRYFLEKYASDLLANS